MVMRFIIIEHDSAYDTIVDTQTNEEYTVVDTQSKKLLNLLNDLHHKKAETPRRKGHNDRNNIWDICILFQ